jgi:hypothetical protein
MQSGLSFDQETMHRSMSHLIINPFYGIESRFKGTDLNNEEIKAYVGERNSNLKTDELDSISKKALDLMIEDMLVLRRWFC